MDDFYLFYSHKIMFLVFLYILVAIYSAIMMLSFYRLKLDVVSIYKKQILAMSVIVALICLSNLYAARVLLILSAQWNVKLSLRVFIQSITSNLYLILTMIFNYVIFGFYCYYHSDWSIRKKKTANLILVIVDFLLCSIIIYFSVISFIYNDSLYLEGLYQFYYAITLVIIILSLLVSVILVIKIAKKLFDYHNARKIRKNACILFLIPFFSFVTTAANLYAFYYISNDYGR